MITKWHQTENESQTRSLKSHCFVAKEFPHPFTDLETVEGNISLCGKIIITEGNEPTERVKLEDIEPHEINQKHACKKCFRIWIKKN